METILLLIKLAEKTCSELKTLRINDQLISRFDNMVIIWKFLAENISNDFDRKTIYHYSFFRTLNEISYIIDSNPSPNNPSLNLSKRFALLWVYLCHIRVCVHQLIFDTCHRHRLLISYLVLKYDCQCDFDLEGNEFYPANLHSLFKVIYKPGTARLNSISELLQKYNPQKYPYLLNKPRVISSFSELNRSLNDSSRSNFPLLAWKIRARAELEAYLVRHGRKVVYPSISKNL